MGYGSQGESQLGIPQGLVVKGYGTSRECLGFPTRAGTSKLGIPNGTGDPQADLGILAASCWQSPMALGIPSHHMGILTASYWESPIALGIPSSS